MTAPFRAALVAECRREVEPTVRWIITLSRRFGSGQSRWGERDEVRLFHLALWYAHTRGLMGKVFGVGLPEVIPGITGAEAFAVCSAALWAGLENAALGGDPTVHPPAARVEWEEKAKALAKTKKGKW